MAHIHFLHSFGNSDKPAIENIKVSGCTELRWGALSLWPRLQAHASTCVKLGPSVRFSSGLKG